ncbi:MAG: methanogenesis marker protein Mmp4/MtxX, partial [Candidatus Lokiarchaeota archaeon]|nr:methanogenesis marker protein Mmp4/MtxX [Candidatus Lokiarchaeota archaeon]MBD3200752.1 methanogenesis marker protein Mmp4/MtxX [Candidatus Lokiarchaeota archaeon]
MNILEKLLTRIYDTELNIGVGLGEENYHNSKILYAIIKFFTKIKNSKYIKIYLFGSEEATAKLSKNPSYMKYDDRIILVPSEQPEITLFDYLSEFKINSIIRGSISSSKFLELVKKTFDTEEIYRLALLETSSGIQFFYGPVGIDECNDLASKIEFIDRAIKEMKNLNLEPNITILSGGRHSDVGRHERVDKTINEAENILEHYENLNPNLEIFHRQILIEQAIEKESNLIIAPDGITGNLIYRTLVHLGSGNAYGAIYMGLDKILIDTSRVGKLSEIYGALILSLALQT